MSIIITDVSKRYGAQHALNKVGFSISPGSVIGLIGPNGAGKTTLMRILCGVLAADEGAITINGNQVSPANLNARRLTGYLPEHNPLYPDMYIREFLHYVAGINGRGRANIEKVIEQTGLTPEIHKKIGQLSKGYRQRVGIAQAIIHDPQVLVLDEPTTGLDPNQIIEIRNLIANAGKEKTVILSTHILQEVEAICDRVVILSKGQVVANDKPGHLIDAMNIALQTIVVEFDREVEEGLFGALPECQVARIDPRIWVIESHGKEDIRPLIFNLCVKNNLTALSIQKRDKRLEEVFRELTSR